MNTEVQTRILKRRASEEEHRIYLAALEWDLVEPIVIESQKDIKSKKKWLDRVTPFAHQVTNLITYCRRLPVTLLADDVGLGKTISAGLILSELVSRDRVTSAIVVCPKLLGPQWKAELAEKFDISSEVAIGKDLLEVAPGRGGVVITTYQSARLYLDRLPPDRFQMLVLDEAHKLRNLYGVEKPPLVATLFRKILEERRFRFVLMLTATPIHNRLWDIYSLVDLLTVARGHKNPFGSEGAFARKFIGDSRETARQLRPEAQAEFRSIVYGYMSRTRRRDANLYFPERVIRQHSPPPTQGELELIAVVAKFIAKMNRLAQISILQALASSPDALKAQTDNMGRNGTVPAELVVEVRRIVAGLGDSAKLLSLQKLFNELKKEDPSKWRVVVFTTRRETQTTIQAFCERHGMQVGLINGDSAAKNQSTIERFKSDPPTLNVVISTEAGSEGVNLQVANVLVNFDLPWNPMIVEQRIGRIQRLASQHANVIVYNVVLRGTFEEYIVARLIQKLQMASQAIGDIESLLEAAGADEEDEGESFEEKIRALVVAALSGKNVEAEAKLTEASITKARETLSAEQQSIDAMLGGGEHVGYVGPRAPKLERSSPSMELKEFTLRALSVLGQDPVEEAGGLYRITSPAGSELISFSDADSQGNATLFSPASSAFQRLVDGIVATAVHDVKDGDVEISKIAANIASRWALGFGGRPVSVKPTKVWRMFEGEAVLRVRATVAHDSYERLVTVKCSDDVHQVCLGTDGLQAIEPVVRDAIRIGINVGELRRAAENDESISEFGRFYVERRDQELQAAGADERRRKKIEDEFTPQLSIGLVSLAGVVRRKLTVRLTYALGVNAQYDDSITLLPSKELVLDAPALQRCAQTGKSVPSGCLEECWKSKKLVLRHLLKPSEKSGRLVLPEYLERCQITGRWLISDELETSTVSGKTVDRELLARSDISGKFAEPEHLRSCEFTGSRGLRSELIVSDVSGRSFRQDQKVTSGLSGRIGHVSEAFQCAETGVSLLSNEGEVCASTGVRVRPGLLETCQVTGFGVRPGELTTSSVSGKRALRRLFRVSNVSGKSLLEAEAITADSGEVCAPSEAKPCAWSGRISHPLDLRRCELLGLEVYREYVTREAPYELVTLRALLDGVDRAGALSDQPQHLIAALQHAGLKGRVRIESLKRSPDGKRLVGVAEVRGLFAFKSSWAGFLYATEVGGLAGFVPVGRRTQSGWMRIGS